MLADMGIYDGLEFCLPLLEHPQARPILELTHKLSTLYRSTNLIDLAADRATKLLFALKTYSHSNTSRKPIPSRITEGVETVLMLYQNHIKRGIEVIRNYDPDLPEILCCPDELDQVWTNLIHNALQAMGDEMGTLTIDVTQNETHIFVKVTDSGKGIPSEILPKIFDSFFTTKTAGKGTGLGLGIAREILDRHSGSIEVESIPGHTTFKVSLPLSGTPLP